MSGKVVLWIGNNCKILLVYVFIIIIRNMVARSIYISFYISKSLQFFINSLFMDSSLLYIVGDSTKEEEARVFEFDKCPGIFDFIKFDFILGFQALVDLWATDFLSGGYVSKFFRFQVNYKFNSLKNSVLSLIYSFSFGIYTDLDAIFAIPTVTDMFDSAPWLEREVWDLFGIYFEGNDDMRRILTDYGFIGYPFRKDFPLFGYSDVRYDEDLGMVVYEPVILNQDFRNFSYGSKSGWSSLFTILIFIWF